MKARVVGAFLAVLGCGGILVIAYLLCAEKVKPAAEELLGGTMNRLGWGVVASLLADVAGAVLLAWSTRPGRAPGADEVFLSHGRPGWATLLLVLAVLIPVSVALWFSILCRLVG